MNADSHGVSSLVLSGCVSAHAARQVLQRTQRRSRVAQLCGSGRLSGCLVDYEQQRLKIAGRWSLVAGRWSLVALTSASVTGTRAEPCGWARSE